MGPELPDLIAGLVSLISLVVFVQFWKPKYRPEYAASLASIKTSSIDEENANQNKVSVTRNSSHDGNSEKYEPEAVNTTSEEKAQVAHTEEVGERVSSNNDSISPREDVTEEAYALTVERPNLRESILAWSPWVIIIVVVIM